ncbi:hypothetical protein VKT23_014432 [Stygiomarasmius scandens]|uniref:Uncharacterized protein n=1 Tax=Marasmiellus scandens TaxID=2682957 RepID=A0ABR1J0K4_9AGAR
MVIANARSLALSLTWKGGRKITPQKCDDVTHSRLVPICFSSYEESQQRDSTREALRTEREDRDRQRSWGGSGASYELTSAANAATSSSDDSRQQRQEYLQREEQRQRQRIPEYDRLRQELRNRQKERKRLRLSMPTPSTSVTSPSSIPVSSSYSSGVGRKDFPQAASVSSSTVYHPPPVSQPDLYPAHISQMRPMTSRVDLQVCLIGK